MFLISIETFPMSLEAKELQHLNRDEEVETSTKRQYYATICMTLLAFGYGCGCGWTSAAVVQLSDFYETPLETGPIDIDDAGWIASGIGIGGFIGNLFFGWVS